MVDLHRNKEKRPGSKLNLLIRNLYVTRKFGKRNSTIACLTNVATYAVALTGSSKHAWLQWTADETRIIDRHLLRFYSL
jgi:hypothetical protein